MAEEIALRVRVTGRVQGVWYRGWTEDEATRRGLRGWVRNEPDGSVAAVLAGPREAVAAMVAAMRRGPPA
ncbi:acylphosphatase, partial [uncultured Amaricoccus sp.]|uniref:acylphosphatase n=2 Tax=Amaricoccus TaxID=56999 RepID=UPI0026186D85